MAGLHQTLERRVVQGMHIIFTKSAAFLLRLKVFVKNVMTNLPKACGNKGLLQSHENTEGGRRAMVQASTFKSALENSDKAIPAIHTKARQEVYGK